MEKYGESSFCEGEVVSLYRPQSGKLIGLSWIMKGPMVVGVVIVFLKLLSKQDVTKQK